MKFTDWKRYLIGKNGSGSQYSRGTAHNRDSDFQFDRLDWNLENKVACHGGDKQYKNTTDNKVLEFRCALRLPTTQYFNASFTALTSNRSPEIIKIINTHICVKGVEDSATPIKLSTRVNTLIPGAGKAIPMAIARIRIKGRWNVINFALILSDNDFSTFGDLAMKQLKITYPTQFPVSPFPRSLLLYHNGLMIKDSFDV